MQLTKTVKVKIVICCRDEFVFVAFLKCDDSSDSSDIIIKICMQMCLMSDVSNTQDF